MSQVGVPVRGKGEVGDFRAFSIADPGLRNGGKNRYLDNWSSLALRLSDPTLNLPYSTEVSTLEVESRVCLFGRVSFKTKAVTYHSRC